MKKIKNSGIIEAVITTVFMGLLVYAAYSLRYIFYGTESGADVHLYTVMSGSAPRMVPDDVCSDCINKAGWIKTHCFYCRQRFVSGNDLGNKRKNQSARQG